MLAGRVGVQLLSELRTTLETICGHLDSAG